MFEFIKKLIGLGKEPPIQRKMPRQKSTSAPASREKKEPVIGPDDRGPMLTIRTPVPEDLSEEFAALKNEISKGQKLESFSYGKKQLSEDFKIFIESFGAYVFNDSIWVSTGHTISEYTLDKGTFLRSFDLPDICPPDFIVRSYGAVAALSSKEILFVLFGHDEDEPHHRYPEEHRKYRSFPVVFNPESDQEQFTVFTCKDSLHSVKFKAFTCPQPGQYIIAEDVDFSSHFSNDFMERKVTTLLDLNSRTATMVENPEIGKECPFFSTTNMHKEYLWGARNIGWKLQANSGLGKALISVDKENASGTKALECSAVFIPDNYPKKFEQPWIKSSRLNNHLLETDLFGDGVITVRYWNIDSLTEAGIPVI